MLKTVGKYRKLDFSKLKFADEPFSMEEVLKDTASFHIPDEVVRSEKQMIIDLKGIHYV